MTATDPTLTDGEYRIYFDNECTILTSGSFQCVAVGSQEQVLDASFSATMINNSDGTYSYSTTITRPGRVTVRVFRYLPGGVQFEYYANNLLTGIPQLIRTEPNIYFNWGTGAIFNGRSDDVTIKIFFRIKGPFTGTVYFVFTADEATVFINGAYLVHQIGFL